MTQFTDAPNAPPDLNELRQEMTETYFEKDIK